ncbi:hypothetical protein NONO_c48370 [Nocardia nova SH22a]|uniref:Uncharacterized protein n=1 Tax=Nocardia nova SH22a TaxID=1415166 RepID=W5TQV0_9NOCA|nr:hypothetical protein [Nocardia nova]AHH19621.1 hypothetical protein NONO_c48370 [Nocardia nova SH22a]
MYQTAEGSAVNPTPSPDRVPVITVDAGDLPELILAVHDVAIDTPRGIRRPDQNVIDIVIATVSDVNPETAQRRYHLAAPPTAAFMVSQQGSSVDVIVEHDRAVASAKFFAHTTGPEAKWTVRLAEQTRHALLAQDIYATLS